ncbi:hypothetical protein IGI04_036231, partial [Brassica rapa subsp. trilocularis]
KPQKIQISATLKQQLIVWENITHQDKVQPGSAADGSSQANDIDGKRKIKLARNSLQENNRKSNDDPKVSIQSYGNEIDAWSEGIILIILLCGVPLFLGC